jgi:hypothetical protein
MRTSCLLAVLLWLLTIGCGEKSDKSGQTTTAPAAGGSSPLSAPADYLGAMGKAQQNAVKTVDTAKLNQAIQMFSAEHGRNPKSLNELVEEKYLPRIPAPPFGMTIQYDPASGKVSVTKQ